MAHKKNAGRSAVPRGNQSPFAAKRTVNPPAEGEKRDTTGGASDQQHDAANRLGEYGGKGEHPRTTSPGHQ
jgi:hypothetical protein